MKCPICIEIDLVMSERQGVEIDYCPKCRGVWLDRGELDKIVERSLSDTAGRPVFPTDRPDRSREDDHHEEHEDHHRERGGYGGYHGRKRSWLGELFD